MATTYSNSASALDRARRALGDTGEDGGVFLLTDEAITAELETWRWNDAVALLAEGLAARFGQYPDETTTPGNHTVRWRDRVSTWLEIAKRLRATTGPGAKTGSRLGTLTNPTEDNLRP